MAHQDDPLAYRRYDEDVPYRRSPGHAANPLWALLLGVAVALAVAALAGWWLWPKGKQPTAGDPDAVPRPVVAAGEKLPEEKVRIEVFNKVKPSVVHIDALTEQRDFYGKNPTLVLEGSGTGFVWDDQGRVVTNYHVIRNADAARVTLADGTKVPAKWVGGDPNYDLAVLKIDVPKNKLQPITVGSSHDLEVGQLAIAIGNPFGLDHSMSHGIVSALDREIESQARQPIKGVIQTDAAINPGNSGGPLLDRSGRLIGVNTAIYSPSGASAGIGFAVPVDAVNEVVPRLVREAARRGR